MQSEPHHSTLIMPRSSLAPLHLLFSLPVAPPPAYSPGPGLVLLFQEASLISWIESLTSAFPLLSVHLVTKHLLYSG